MSNPGVMPIIIRMSLLPSEFRMREGQGEMRML